MASLNKYFDFSQRQLRVLAALSILALALSGWLLFKTYATPTEDALRLPVTFSEGDSRIAGIFELDPNTAPVYSLELLPGIGRVLADRIVAYRQHTRFHAEIDIMRVKGIGPSTYERLAPYLKVQP